MKKISSTATTASAADILARCPMWQNVTDTQLQKLTDMALIRRYRKGQTVFLQGQSTPGIFVVDQGLVRIYKTSSDGREHVLHLAGPGSMFAEVAVIAGFPCPAHAQALERSRCLVLPAVLFMRLLREDSTFSANLLAGMCRWVHRMVGLLEDVVLRDAAARVASYLIQRAGGQATVGLPATKRQIANHLNLTGETLSRVLRRLVQLRVVEVLSTRQLQVLQPGLLQQIALGRFSIRAG